MEPELISEGSPTSRSASSGAASADQDEEDHTPDEHDAMIEVLVVAMGFPHRRAVEGLIHGGGTVTGAIDWIEAQDNDDDDDGIEKRTRKKDAYSNVEENQEKGRASDIMDVKTSGSRDKAKKSDADNKHSLPPKKISSVPPEVVPSELPYEGRNETTGRRKKIPQHGRQSLAAVPEIFSAPRRSAAMMITTRGKAITSSGGGNSTADRPETVPVCEPSMRTAAHHFFSLPFVQAAPRAGGTSNSSGSNPEAQEQEGTARVFADRPLNPSGATIGHTHEEGGANVQNQATAEDIGGNGESDALSAYVVSEQDGNRREQTGGNEISALRNAGMGMVENPDEGVYDGVAINDHASEPPQGFVQKHRAAVGIAVLSVAMAVAIAVPVAVTWSHSNSFEEGGEVADTQGNFENTPLFTITSKRFSVIKSFLQAQMDGSLAGDPTSLDNEVSPQWRALRWLAEEDARQVDVDDELSLTQRFALATIYFTTGGADGFWIRGSRFLSLDHECQWWETCNIFSPDHDCGEGELPTGVLCSDNMTIHVFRMDSNNMSGTLPAEVGLLSSLWALSLFGNAIKGSIPSSLNKLQNLKFLYLYENALTGPIPSSLGSLRELRHLWLEHNSLSGMIPSSLGSLTELQDLWLALNNLSGPIPTQLGQLSNLQTLALLSNSITGSIPSELNTLDNLTDLFLYKNLLSGTLPFMNGSLPNIEVFSTGENTLTGVTDYLCSLKTLVAVDLRINSFTGTVPTCLGDLSSLFYLAFSENKIRGQLPSELSQLSELRNLELRINYLTGTVPTGFGDLAKVGVLSLAVNQLTGLVPTSLSNLRHLELLELQGNSFTGELDFVCEMSPALYATADCHAASPHEDPEVMCWCCSSCCHDEIPGPDLLGCFTP